MYLPRIAIAGGGPSGLLLARLLKVKGIPSTVYELDQNEHSRSQGGSLDLHKQTGQQGLQDAGLIDEFWKVARPEGEVLRIFDENENLRMDEGGGKGARPIDMHDRPEVDRSELRRILIQSLEPQNIRWGPKLDSVTRHEDGFQLNIANAQSEHADVIIGADGAWSKVRPLVSTTKPGFCGITGAEVNLWNVDDGHVALSERVGHGMCLTLGPNRGILAQRSGNKSIQVYAFMREAEDWHQTSGIEWANEQSAKKQLIAEKFADWSGPSQALVLDSDRILPRPLYQLPIGFRWEHQPSVTLIGDAAHLMPPFAGVGVNVAMEDALLLARSLIERSSSWSNRKSSLAAISDSIRSYEDSMFGRAEDNAKKTAMFQDLFFHPRGASAMIEHFEKANKEAESSS